MQLFTALLSALALVSSTTALPAPGPAEANVYNGAPPRRDEKIVINPPIISPGKGATWKIGSTQSVTWQTSVIPPSGQHNTGHLVLGFDDGTGSENLQFNTPLASGFLLTSGSHPVKVPAVSPNTTYFVVLFGDSGNKSPHITITY